MQKKETPSIADRKPCPERGLERKWAKPFLRPRNAIHATDRAYFSKQKRGLAAGEKCGLQHGLVTLDQFFKFHHFFGAQVNQGRPNPSGRLPKDPHRGLDDRHFVAFAASAETV